MTDLVDWKAEAKNLEALLKETLNPILQGVQSSLDGFYREVAADLVEAASLGRADLVKEIKLSARVRGERLRVRSSERGWQQIGRVLELAGGLASRLMAGVLMASSDGTATGPGAPLEENPFA